MTHGILLYFLYRSSIFSISFVDSTHIKEHRHIIDLGKLSDVFDNVLYAYFARLFIGGDMSASLLST